MKKYLFHFIADIWKKFGYRIFVLIGAMILNGLTEGLGLALLLPLLSVMGIGSANSQNTISAFFMKVFDYFHYVPELKTMLIIIVAFFTLQGIVFICQSYLAAWLQHSYTFLWKKNLFSSYMDANWSFFTKNKVGSLSNAVIGEIDRLGGAFFLINQLVSAVTIIMVYISVSTIASWQATLIMALTGGILGSFTYVFVRKGYQIGKNISQSADDQQSVVTEYIGGVKVLKTTSTEGVAKNLYLKVISKLRKNYFHSSLHPNLMRAIFELSGIITLCCLLYIGVIYLHIDISVIMVIVAVFMRLVPKMYGLMQNMQALAVYLPSIETAGHYLDLSRQNSQHTGGSENIAVLGDKISIEAQDLCFSYDKKIILDKVNLKIPAGNTVGIIGLSGAGKSTLVDCILRLVEPSGGRILANGIPIENFSTSQWRRAIGYVQQETFLFHDSVRENILWSVPKENGVDPSISEAAAKHAFIHDYIVGLPEGYNTMVGDRGVRLSGGQKQRLGLARALAHNPSILILDEATSALDSESENKVMEAIDTMRGKVTMIIIAHRLSTVRNTDYIYVLEHGKIIEEGPWEKLVSQKERFYEFLKLQSNSV